jgi:hypothetical protein
VSPLMNRTRLWEKGRELSVDGMGAGPEEYWLTCRGAACRCCRAMALAWLGKPPSPFPLASAWSERPGVEALVGIPPVAELATPPRGASGFMVWGGAVPYSPPELLFRGRMELDEDGGEAVVRGRVGSVLGARVDSAAMPAPGAARLGIGASAASCDLGVIRGGVLKTACAALLSCPAPWRGRGERIRGESAAGFSEGSILGAGGIFGVA